MQINIGKLLTNARMKINEGKDMALAEELSEMMKIVETLPSHVQPDTLATNPVKGCLREDVVQNSLSGPVVTQNTKFAYNNIFRLPIVLSAKEDHPPIDEE